MTKSNGITITPAPEGYRGSVKGGDVTTYYLKRMRPADIEKYGLQNYVRGRENEKQKPKRSKPLITGFNMTDLISEEIARKIKQTLGGK